MLALSKCLIEFTCEAIWSWTFVCWKIFFFNFIYLFMAVLGLHFCARAFSSCGKRGPLFIVVRGPLTVAASLVAEHRLQTRRLSNCSSQASCSVACGIFPNQGSNPCPPHWQADSQPLRHQGSPCWKIFNHSFNFITCDWSVDIFCFFLVQSWKLYLSRNLSISSRLSILLA